MAEKGERGSGRRAAEGGECMEGTWMGRWWWFEKKKVIASRMRGRRMLERRKRFSERLNARDNVPFPGRLLVLNASVSGNSVPYLV